MRDERPHCQPRQVEKVEISTPLIVPSFSSCGFPHVLAESSAVSSWSSRASIHPAWANSIPARPAARPEGREPSRPAENTPQNRSERRKSRSPALFRPQRPLLPFLPGKSHPRHRLDRPVNPASPSARHKNIKQEHHADEHAHVCHPGGGRQQRTCGRGQQGPESPLSRNPDFSSAWRLHQEQSPSSLTVNSAVWRRPLRVTGAGQEVLSSPSPAWGSAARR